MVVIAGKFGPKQQAKKEEKVSTPEKMMQDLGLDNLVVISSGDRSTVVAYFNDYEGKNYFHIRTVWQKRGQWMHGKGLAIDPAMAKDVLTNLGELGGKL